MTCSLSHMKITASVTRNLHQDCGPCYLHLTYFFLIHTLIKKLTDINQCLTNPADRCLTDFNRYYISYSTYLV